MVAHSVRDIKNVQDKDRISYVRKSIILCSLVYNVNGLWEESQLKPEIQNIITNYRAEFETPKAKSMICQTQPFFFLQ